jgi:hypothetical protein
MAYVLPMARRWPWHLLGFIAGLSICYAWLAVLTRKLPVPPMMGGVFIGWFLGSVLLSIAAGRRGSKWWYLVTVCFGLTLVLLWVGEAMWESR